MRFLCYGLDKAINAADKTRNPSGKVTGIFDLEGKNLFHAASLHLFCLPSYLSAKTEEAVLCINSRELYVAY